MSVCLPAAPNHTQNAYLAPRSCAMHRERWGTRMRPHGWGQQDRRLGIWNDMHRSTGTSRNQATWEQETLTKLAHCSDLLGEITQVLNQIHLRSSHLLSLWPWANHFVFLNCGLLTKAMGIIMRRKQKDLEQHVIHRRRSRNPQFLSSLPLSLPSLFLLFVSVL